MNIVYAAILGLVQGIAEFLPISSSGHLALFENVLGAAGLAELGDSAMFNIMLHLATLVAVIVAYWSDVKGMILEVGHMGQDLAKGRGLSARGIPMRRQIFMLIAATLPLFLIVPFNDKIESLSGVSWFVGAALIVTGLLLFIADRMPKGKKTEKSMTVADALIIGVAQAAATIPGLSRSGTTITAGMGRGLKRSYAVRFSFLMSLLSVLGAVLLQVLDVIGEGFDTALLPAYAVGMVVAGVTGYLSIRLLQKIVDKGRFGGFAYYCWAVGALTIILSIVMG
ncbi:MAG: undecaprenyl-diphosphate phosphatase [Oscillospiraceae bacterium]|nr:undecaprenyl-diphosphate phosphatase [Oscillospiraceae bacterium]